MKKLTNKKGFTLMEMIIVVAIIAILAVITIPTLTGNTKAAEKSADAANLRSAKAVYQVMQLNGETPAGNYFDTATGTFGATEDKCGKCSEHKDESIQIKDGKVVWSGGVDACPAN